MGRTRIHLVVVAIGLTVVHHFSPEVIADPPAKDKKADEKETGKKAGVKKADTTPAGSLAGKIKTLETNALTLEAGAGLRRQDLDLLIADDVKIRVPLQREFDEKGRPKPFKPDPNDPDRRLGGSKGSQADLREGQTVQVTLGRLPNKKLVATVIVVVMDIKK